MIEKEFRVRPWWKAPEMFHNLMMLIFAPDIGFICLVLMGLPLNVVFGSWCGVTIFLFLLVSTHCFGVLLTTDELILQNGIFPFWRKKVAYASLEKVLCWGIADKKHPFIVVYKKGYVGFHWHYIIYQVDKKDYAALVEALRTRGVTVEIKGGFIKE